MSISSTIAVFRKGSPHITCFTSRQQNLIEPVHLSVRYNFDKSSMASNRYWVGGDKEAHKGAVSVFPSAAMVNTMDTYIMVGNGKELSWGKKYGAACNGLGQAKDWVWPAIDKS